MKQYASSEKYLFSSNSKNQQDGRSQEVAQGWVPSPLIYCDLCVTEFHCETQQLST